MSKPPPPPPPPPPPSRARQGAPVLHRVEALRKFLLEGGGSPEAGTALLESVIFALRQQASDDHYHLQQDDDEFVLFDVLNAVDEGVSLVDMEHTWMHKSNKFETKLQIMDVMRKPLLGHQQHQLHMEPVMESKLAKLVLPKQPSITQALSFEQPQQHHIDVSAAVFDQPLNKRKRVITAENEAERVMALDALHKARDAYRKAQHLLSVKQKSATAEFIGTVLDALCLKCKRFVKMSEVEKKRLESVFSLCSNHRKMQHMDLDALRRRLNQDDDELDTFFRHVALIWENALFVYDNPLSPFKNEDAVQDALMMKTLVSKTASNAHVFIHASTECEKMALDAAAEACRVAEDAAYSWL